MTPGVCVSGAVNNSIGPVNGPVGDDEVYATTCESNMRLFSWVTQTYWLPTFCTPPPSTPLISRPDAAASTDQALPVQNCQAPDSPPVGTRARWANLMSPETVSKP